MNLKNATKFPAACTMGMEPSGREHLVVIVKGTFTIPSGGGELQPAKDQVPLVAADLFEGEPGLSAPIVESDFPPKKPRCDVVLNGKAYAPGGQPAETVPVMLQVGPLSKSFNVVGNRAWVNDPFGWRSTRPVPFVKMAISYGNAFGGRDVSDPDEKNHQWFGANHAGVGFHANLYAPLVEGKPLPNTEEIGKPVLRPDGTYRPMAFGPIGRAWDPRARLAGTCDQNWLDNVCPFLPSDFKDEYYQCAPPDQQIPHPKGGEEVTLVNLTPEGRTAFRLPSAEMPVTFFLKDGGAHETTGIVDTIMIEPDLRRVALTWRASRPIKNMFAVTQVFVGRLSPGLRRARKVGKEYAPSLAHAIGGTPRGPKGSAS